MTSLRITSEKLGINEIVQLSWTIVRQVQGNDNGSIEASASLVSADGEKVVLEFIKGDTLHGYGDSITLVAVRDDEGILIEDADVKVSLPPGRPSQGRSVRLQTTVTEELRDWLQAQRANGESLSDVMYRLLLAARK